AAAQAEERAGRARAPRGHRPREPAHPPAQRRVGRLRLPRRRERVTANFFGTPGAKENSFPMYSRSQAMKIRDTLFIRLEKAAASPRTDDGLRVVVVGGGATGVEVAGALAELRTAGLRPAYPEIHGDAFEVKIVQRGNEVLKSFDPRLRTYAADELRRRGVDLHLGAGVAEVLPD